MKFTLELSEKQMTIMLSALDLYSRVHLGQYTDLPNNNRESQSWPTRIEDANVIKKILFPDLPPNGYYGIHSDEISDNARISWDLQQVIRYNFHWRRSGKDPENDIRDWHTMMMVQYDAPYLTSTTESLPVLVDMSGVLPLD